MQPPPVQKGYCHECPAYTDCPRMRGINVCLSVLKQQNQNEAAQADPPEQAPTENA